MPIIGSLAGASSRGLGGFRTFGLISLSSYESIETVNVTTPQATVVFNNIPATYKHLQIRGFAKSGINTQLDTTFNSDTGANYSHRTILGYGSGVDGGGNGQQSRIVMEAMASSVYSTYVIDISDYASTSKSKTTRNFAGYDTNGSGRVSINSGCWHNYTSPITSITLTCRSSSFQNYSSFALYGIKG